MTRIKGWKRVNKWLYLKNGSDRGVAIRKFPEGYDVSYVVYAGRREDRLTKDDVYYNVVSLKKIGTWYRTEGEAINVAKNYMKKHPHG